jgi:hypothetical protein
LRRGDVGDLVRHRGRRIPLAGWLARDSYYLPALQISFVAIPALTMLALDAAFARAFGWMAFVRLGGASGAPAGVDRARSDLAAVVPELSASGWVTLCALAYVVSALGQHAVVRRLIAGKVHTAPRSSFATTGCASASACCCSAPPS